MEWTDTWRELNVGMAGLSIGLSFVVMGVYYRANRTVGGERTTQARALTRHVAAIALAHNLLMIALAIEISRRIGHGDFAWWRQSIASIAFTLTVYALWQMLGFQRSRLHVLKSGPVVAVELAEGDVVLPEGEIE